MSHPPVRVATRSTRCASPGHANYHRDDKPGNAPFASRVGLRDDYAIHRPDAFTDTGRSVLSESDRFNVNRPGRFSAIDPLPRRGTAPQSLNRYSYAHNDPIGREDPSGMLDNLVCGPLGDCSGMDRPIEGDFAGDIAAGHPSVATGGSGPSGAGTFSHDTGDPSQPPTGICPDNEPGCGICDPIGCMCDPTFDPSYCNFWPKVGWAHYVELVALLRYAATSGEAICECTLIFESARFLGCLYECICSDGLPDLFAFDCPLNSQKAFELCPPSVVIRTARRK